jgi:hypothetical protein
MNFKELTEQISQIELFLLLSEQIAAIIDDYAIFTGCRKNKSTTCPYKGMEICCQAVNLCYN